MPDQQLTLFKSFVERERRFAAEATLDHIRVMHLRAAAMWEELAARLERKS